jgi:hypothetical protein
MDIFTKISSITYKPYLCKLLCEVDRSELEIALSQNASFILKIDLINKIALSWWVSAKRTRSYPYARVYDTLGFIGKKITIIPVYKDEGKDGDRDFLQWDTISLMSLLGVYVIISYYSKAEKNIDYENKITNQRFDISHIQNEIERLSFYKSDSLHWNIGQIENIGNIAKQALLSYEKISNMTQVVMHSMVSAEKRINKLVESKKAFMHLSRELAKKAQMRESVTIHPKEYLNGSKSVITIKNFLGGKYYFTADDVFIKGRNIYLVEGKHTKNSILPSLEDIKDGLIKMVLFSNLEKAKVNNRDYIVVPILRLTSDLDFSLDALNKSQLNTLRLLKKESEENHFKVFINKNGLSNIIIEL